MLSHHVIVATHQLRIRPYIFAISLLVCIPILIGIVFTPTIAEPSGTPLTYFDTCASPLPTFLPLGKIPPPTNTILPCNSPTNFTIRKPTSTQTPTGIAIPKVQIPTVRYGPTPFSVVTGSGIVVNNFNQELPPYPTDGTCTLAKAIVAVNTHSQVDTCRGDLYTTIILNNGLYQITQDDNLSQNGPSNAPPYNGFPVITGNAATGQVVTIEGNNSTIQDSTTLPSSQYFRLFEVASSANVTFKNITFANSYINAWQFGGSIYNSGILSLIGDVFVNNLGSGEGSAVYNAASGSLTISSSLFNGSASYAGAAIANFGSANVSFSSFLYNGTSYVGGGAIYNAGGASLGVGYSVFIGNSGPQGTGGAIYNSSTNEVSVYNNCFIHNSQYNNQAVINTGGIFDAFYNWWDSDSSGTKAGGTDGRPGPVGPNTDPNADTINNGVNWSLAMNSLPNYCQARIARSQQWPGVYRQSNNTFYLKVSYAGPYADVTKQYGSGSNALPIVGDWSGQGVDEVGVFYPNNATFDLSGVGQFVFGNANDLPLAGHWSPGASHSAIGIYRPSNGLILLSNQLPAPSTDYTMVFGIPGDKAIAGDWAGIGTDTIGIYRPSSQTFYLADQMCSCSLYADYAFALGPDQNAVPLAGDWLGAGSSSVGIEDYTQYTLQLVLDSDSTNFVYGPYGLSSDIPVAGRWAAVCGVPPGNIAQSGVLSTCHGPTGPTSTPTASPSPVPTLLPNIKSTAAAQTATAALTPIAQGTCVFQFNPGVGTTIPLMNYDLATIPPVGIQVGSGSIFIPQSGRGSLSTTRTPPAYLSYYSVQYYGQPGWVYTGSSTTILGTPSACKAGPVPTQVLNYQVPSTLAPAPVYVPTQGPGPASTLDCVQVNCNNIGLTRAVYDGFVSQFISTYQRPPTIRDLLAITIYQEWFTSVGGITQANQYAEEGLSRNYYADCKYNTCTPVELVVFLSGYQEWHVQTTVDAAVQALIGEYVGYSTVANQPPIDVLVSNVLVPTPPLTPTLSWVTGLSPNRPWQWFTYLTSTCPNGTNRQVGNASNQVLYRITTGNTIFEIYTNAQNNSLGSGPCKNQ